MLGNLTILHRFNVLANGELVVIGAFEKLNIQKEMQRVQNNVLATLQLTHPFIPQMLNRGK